VVILDVCFCGFGNIFCWGGVVIIGLGGGIVEFWGRDVVEGWLVRGVEERELVQGGGLGSCDGTGSVGGMRVGRLIVWVVDFVGRGEECGQRIG